MKENFFSNLKQCYLIAEIGVNHNGDMALARKMIDAAKSSGANAVKFQTFTADALVSKGTPKVKYQEATTSPKESHFEMIKKLELRKKDHLPLKKYSEKLGLDFISTPYDIECAKFLSDIGVKIFKTASADLVDLPLQNFLAKTRKPSIVSIGMATLGEIEETISIYKKAKNPNLILLHCVSNYPCSDKSLNMKVVETIKNTFKYPVGYSDHSIGEVAATMSLVMGAKVIEKHFTIDKNLPGPDHKASSTPDEFLKLVNSIRRAELMLGDGLKKCEDEEREMSKVSRKSIVLLKDIKENEVFSNSNITLKRPGTGLESKYLDYFLGRRVAKNIKKDTLLRFSDIKE